MTLRLIVRLIAASCRYQFQDQFKSQDKPDQPATILKSMCALILKMTK